VPPLKTSAAKAEPLGKMKPTPTPSISRSQPSPSATRKTPMADTPTMAKKASSGGTSLRKAPPPAAISKDLLPYKKTDDTHDDTADTRSGIPPTQKPMASQFVSWLPLSTGGGGPPPLPPEIESVSPTWRDAEAQTDLERSSPRNTFPLLLQLCRRLSEGGDVEVARAIYGEEEIPEDVEQLLVFVEQLYILNAEESVVLQAKEKEMESRMADMEAKVKALEQRERDWKSDMTSVERAKELEEKFAVKEEEYRAAIDKLQDTVAVLLAEKRGGNWSHTLRDTADEEKASVEKEASRERSSAERATAEDKTATIKAIRARLKASEKGDS